MPKTLLAVDDSATMRKVLEITFAGEDFRVITADGSQSALARMNERPAVAVIDTSLQGVDGYSLAKEVRARDARIAIVMLSSRYNPYDANRGREAGADDSADKPFDTQTLIEKVKKAVVAREAMKAAPAPGHAAATVPFPPATSPQISPQFAAASQAASTASSASVAPRGHNLSTQRTHTLSFEASQVAPPFDPAPSAVTRTVPSGVAVVPLPPAREPAPIAPERERTIGTASADTATAAARPNGPFSGRLGELGLSVQQVDAVLALSRELVENVVWEVVPQLAEVLIKEEIARLMKEG
ncbi:MAG: response regulator [Myxococcota bacterium]|nr:response regulator [Myxococcota bacterium]